VRRKIYDAMIAERNKIADTYRSEGRGRQAELEGERERELRGIESEAVRQAEVIRGEADAEATRIYAEAYGQDQDFYAYYQTLETWKKALAGGDTTLVLSTQSELLRYLKGPAE
jgi:membrane protease subunit HflC